MHWRRELLRDEYAQDHDVPRFPRLHRHRVLVEALLLHSLAEHNDCSTLDYLSSPGGDSMDIGVLSTIPAGASMGTHARE